MDYSVREERFSRRALSRQLRYGGVLFSSGFGASGVVCVVLPVEPVDVVVVVDTFEELDDVTTAASFF